MVIINVIPKITHFINFKQNLAGFSEDSDYTSDVNFPVNGPLSNPSGSNYLPHTNNVLVRQKQQLQLQQQQPYSDHNSQQHPQDHYYYDTGQKQVKKKNEQYSCRLMILWIQKGVSYVTLEYATVV